MRRAFYSFLVTLCAFLGTVAASMGEAAAKDLLVLAPSSMTEALTEAMTRYEEKSGQTVAASFAGTAVLARQAAAGAPADLVITADEKWMDWLQTGDFIDPATRRILFGNSLVLIGKRGLEARAGNALIGSDFSMRELLGDGRMALARIETVPAGRYAKEALKNLGLWDGIADRVVETENVRAALILVQRGEARLGIVYASDLAIDADVVTLGALPGDSHEPILYPGALLRQARDAASALAFLDFLGTEEGQKAFLDRKFSKP